MHLGLFSFPLGIARKCYNYTCNKHLVRHYLEAKEAKKTFPAQRPWKRGSAFHACYRTITGIAQIAKEKVRGQCSKKGEKEKEEKGETIGPPDELKALVCLLPFFAL